MGANATSAFVDATMAGSPAVVPEPNALALLAAALGTMAVLSPLSAAATQVHREIGWHVLTVKRRA